MSNYSVEAVFKATGVGNFTKSFKDAERSVKGFVDNNAKTFDSFKQVGKVATVAGTAIAGSLGFAVKKAADFEGGMSKVAAVSGATGSDLQDLTDIAREMGSKTSFSATEAAEGLEYMALAGWDTNQMVSGLEPVLHLAEAGALDLGRASDLVTDSMASMGIEVQDLDGYLDKVAATSANANTDIDALMEAFVIAGGTFQRLNVPLEESNAFLGILANRGTKGAEAGTAINAIMTRLTKTTGPAAEALEDMGIAAFDADGNFRGMETVLKEVEVAMADMTDEQKAQAVEMLAGLNHGKSLEKMLNGLGDEYDDLKDDITNSNGALKTMRDIMKDNLQGSLENLSSAFEEMAIGIGEALIPAVEWLVEVIQGLVDWFNDLSEDTKSFIAIGAAVASIFLLIVGPMMLLIGFIPSIVSGFGHLKLVFFGIGKVIMWLVGIVGLPWLLIIAAIAIATALIYVYWEPIKEFFINLWSSIVDISLEVWEVLKQAWSDSVEYLKAVWQSVVEFFTPMWEMIKEIFMKVWEPIKVIWEEVISTLTQLWEGTMEFFTELWGIIQEIFLSIWEPIKEGWLSVVEFAKEVWTPISAFFSEMWTEITEIFSLAWELITIVFETAWAVIQPIVELGMSIVSDIVTTYFEIVKEIFTVAFDVIVTIVSVAWDVIKEVFTAVLGVIKSVVLGAFNVIKSIVSSVMGVISSIVKAVWGVIKAIITTVLDIIMAVVRAAFNIIKTIIQTVLSVVKAIVSGDFNQMQGVMTTILNAMKSIATTVWNAIKSVLTSVLNGIKGVMTSVWNGIKNTVTSVVNAIKSVVTSIFNALKGIVTSAMGGVKSAVSTGINGALKIITGIASGFFDAGKNIITSVAKGIKSAAGAVAGAVKGVASKIRNFFPFSPAKEGPLKDIMKIKFSESVAQAIDNGKNAALRSASNLASGLQGELAGAGDFNVGGRVNDINRQAERSLSHTFNSNLNVGKQPIVVHTTIDVDGRVLAETVDEVNAVDASVRRF